MWVAASTHQPEEDDVGFAHVQLQQQVPGILTFLVPRHPNRCVSIKRQLEELYHLRCELYSKWGENTIPDEVDVMIVDTIGLLTGLYALCGVCFLGGSMVAGIGGHNPLECCSTLVLQNAQLKYSCALIHGAFVDNNQDLFDTIHQHRTQTEHGYVEAASQVSNRTELVQELLKLLTNDSYKAAKAKALEDCIHTMRGGTLATIWDSLKQMDW